MKLLIIGATGGTGRCVVENAFRQGTVNVGTLSTLMGACVLTVLNFVSGLYLAKVRDTPN